ncbi:MAG: hypothetical protein ACRCUT_06885 [Spirochaetota bacterium]
MDGKNGGVHFCAYSLDDSTQDIIKDSLERILSAHGCEEILIPVFSCIIELMINAVKANFKNIYFENYCPQNKSIKMIPYSTALELFRLEIQQDQKHLTRLARLYNKAVNLDMQAEEGILNVSVTNPSPMTDVEAKNVLRKMKDLESVKEITEYFISNADDPHHEGAGIGIVFVGLMLKGLGVPVRSLRISSAGRMTTARLSVPLNAKTVAAFRAASEKKQ